MRRILGFLSAVTLLGTALAPEAEACSPAICQPDIAPGSLETIPHDAPALAIDPDLHPGFPNSFDAGSIQLLNADGGQVEFTLEQESGGRYLVRPAALEDGRTYHLTLPHPCFATPSDADGGEVIIPKALPSTYANPYVLAVYFQAGPSAPLPEAMGTVSVTPSAEVVMAGSYCGSCASPLAAAVAELQFTPSAQLQPFLPVTRLEVRVDGQLWAESAYGSGLSSNTSPGAPVRSVQRVFASCAPNNPYVSDHGVSPGRRSIEVRAHVAGANVDPAPVVVEVDLDCAPWAGRERPAETCGFVEPDAGGPVDDADGGTGTEPPSGGCTGSGWFGVGALLSAVVFRKRRGAI